MVHSWAIVGVTIASFLLASDPPIVKSARPAPDLDALFRRTGGWIGADGVYSVSPSQKRTLWLFSDTWVGKVRDGRRVDATIVNNSVGVQDQPGGRVNYSMGRRLNGKPAALIVPSDGRGWFWLQAGVASRGRLWLFLNQCEKTNDKSVFGFRAIGGSLGIVTNVDQPPESWRVEQSKLPNTIFSEKRTLAWGAATLQVADELYIYGIDERRGGGFPNRQMVVARVPIESVGNFNAWRYFRDGLWDKDFQNASPLAGGIASEYSVTRFGNRYLAVYTEVGLSPRIMGRMAEHPWGPWSTPALLYGCPEMSRDKKLFCYAAKAHPALSSGTDVVVSYVVNSFDFWQVARDANLYWPRFVRLKLEPSK